MFRIKICGLTRAIDVRAAAEGGADAIGLNFYAKSPRVVSLERARELVRECPPGVLRVGVFVNAPAEDIRRTAKETPLDVVQLHGDEPPEIMDELKGLRVIRAIRPRTGEWPLAMLNLHAYRSRGTLESVLVDAPSSTEYGGTGQLADWDAIHKYCKFQPRLPLILAGGLRPENIAEAIRAVRPDAVDTASGVETSPGIKDAELIREFVAKAREAFAGKS